MQILYELGRNCSKIKHCLLPAQQQVAGALNSFLMFLRITDLQ